MDKLSTVTARLVLGVAASGCVAVLVTLPVRAPGIVAVLTALLVGVAAAARVRAPARTAVEPTGPSMAAFERIVTELVADGDGVVSDGPDPTPDGQGERIPVGRSPDGTVRLVSPSSGVVVVGRGAVARSVFDALLESIAACLPDGHEMRVARPGSSARSTPVDTAVGVVLDALMHPVASVVLVPTDDRRPRSVGAVVRVGRHRVTVAEPDGPSVAIDPVLTAGPCTVPLDDAGPGDHGAAARPGFSP